MNTPPLIRYTVAMPTPHTHLFHVTLELDGLSGPTLTLALPVWTPGSYMVREYARHLQDFAAHAGEAALDWQKLDKSRWQVQTGGAASVTVSYQVYANELTVRTSHLDGSHGYFNPATLALYVPGREQEPHGITVVPPAGWHVSTGLEPLDTDDRRPTTDDRRPVLGEPENSGGHGSVVGGQRAARAPVGGQWSFLAPDYDALVDSPFECGTHRILSFVAGGVTHEVALWGHGNEDEAPFLADIQRIVTTELALFGAPPYSRYTFIYHLADGYGGLEHRNSVTNLVDRWSFQPRKSYERVLGLTSHEYFHTWLIKRIRPQPLGPFDYQQENYTRQLWTIEGVTSYYDNLLLLRAGLLTPQRYLETLAEDIALLQSQPGRALQSLAQSSFDTWIKFYRPDENTPNSAISYYLKGSLVALLLDLQIRARSGGQRSLDDLLLALNATADGPGFAEDDGFRDAVEEIAGESYAAFFARYVTGTEELDYASALAPFGLRLEWQAPRASAWLGIKTRTEHGKLKVQFSYSGGPAEAAGVYANDEIVALNGFRVDEEKLNQRLVEHAVGDSVTVSVFRREELLHIAVTLATAPAERPAIVLDEQADPAQTALRKPWLGI